MSKKQKNILGCILSIVIVSVFVVPFLVQAQGGSNTPVGGGNIPSTPPLIIKIDNPFKSDSIQGLIKVIIDDILMPIGAVVAVLMIMYAGFLYVTARGNPAQIQKAHQALLWACIGAAILLGAWVISQAIQGTINDLRR